MNDAGERASAVPPTRQRPLAATLVVLLLCGLLSAYCASHMRVTSDITHFLPSGEGAWAARVLKELSRSALGQRMVLTIADAHGDPERLARASAEFARALSTLSSMMTVQRGVPEEAQRKLFDLYFPRRYHLFSDAPERDFGALLSDAGLRRAANHLVSQLGGVQGPFIRRIAERDPLLAFPRLMGRLEAARDGGLVLRDGAFFTPDGRHAVLFVTTHASALDGTAQREVLTSIRRAFNAVNHRLGGSLTLEQSGVNLYSVYAEQSIKSDVQRVSTISTVALLVLFFALFRTLRSLAFVAFTPLFSVLVASAATLFAFGELHGATLAFGATLVGVCVDFPVHLLGHHTLGTHGDDAHRTLASIWPAIRLGGLTTLAGLFGLSLASFPGIREMAFFTGVGVLASLALTRYALPHVLGPGGRATGTQRAIAAWLGRKVAALRARPALSGLLLVAALALCIGGIPGMRFQDDLASWVPAPAELRAEDERVRARVIGTEPGRLVVATAANEEAALAANDALAAVLGEAQRAGEISGFRSLHALLFSEGLQQRNLAAIAKAPDLRARFAPALDAAGFTPEAFAPFFADLAHPAPALRLPELLASPLAPLASALAIEVDGRPALLTHLRGVRDPQALERRIATVSGARYFDQREFLRSTYARFRARTLELLGAGLGLVFLLILARYRAFRPTLAALLPAVLAAGGALSALSLLSVEIDLFHVIGVLLVLSMGEDYGVFLVESEDQAGLPATLLGLLLACASTVLSFGLLAASAIPALRSLGQVISIGMVLALFWAPAGLVLLRAPARRTP